MATAPGASSRPRRFRRLALPIAAILLLAGVTIPSCVLVPYRIVGDSMSPGLLGGGAGRRGDVVLVDRVGYSLLRPARWDVVVIARPGGAASGSGTIGESVKRIVGLPGETVEIRNGALLIDGAAVACPGPAAGAWVVSKGPYGRGPHRLRADEYFVLGDNSYASLDSRAWGPVARSEIRGRVRWIVLPVARAGTVR